MEPVYYVIGFAGLALELVLVWRGFIAGLWRRFPFLYAYLTFVLARSVALYVLMHNDHSSYAIVYWRSNVVSLALFFLVPWEVFRHLFSQRSTLRWIARFLLLVLLLSVTASMYLFSNSPGNFYTDLERKLSLLQATFLGITLFLATYYRTPLDRNLWGLALGFGIYVSVSMINFSAFDLLTIYRPYWQLVRPISFNLMLSIWLWALWSPVSVATLQVERIGDREKDVKQWREAWARMQTALRKAINP